jgi:hypothetical protein
VFHGAVLQPVFRDHVFLGGLGVGVLLHNLELGISSLNCDQIAVEVASESLTGNPNDRPPASGRICRVSVQCWFERSHVQPCDSN